MTETALTWIIFILAFGGMVVVHELGHFIAARLVKVEVEEFGIGFPTPGAVTLWVSPGYLLLRSGKRVEIPHNFRLPVLWSSLVDHEASLTIREKNGSLILQAIEAVVRENARGDSPASAENTQSRPIKAGKAGDGTALTDVIAEVHPGTIFTLNWLPIGGFVRPKGENDPSVPGGLAAAAPWKRLFVLSAGPFMNLLTAVLVISLIISQMGGIIVSPPPDSNATQPLLITEVVAGSPAEQGGIQVGDILLTVNGQTLTSPELLSQLIQSSLDTPLRLEVRRGSETLTLTVVPRLDAQAGKPKIGIGYCPGCEFKPIVSFTETLVLSLQVTGAQIYALATLPIRLLRGSIDPEQGRLIGLKGIFDIMSQSVSNDVEAAQTQPSAPPSSAPNPNAPVQTLSLIALLSISLGIFNLFPFPALDGGRILFVLPELIFRRRVPHKLENLVHGIGMALLLILMIYVNVRDFIDPVIP